LREWYPLEDAHCDVVGTKLLDHAPKFGDSAKGLVGAEGRNLLQLSQNRLAFRRPRFRYAGLPSMEDQRRETMVLNELEKSLPVELAGRSLADEFAVLRPLRPPRAQQKQIQFGRTSCRW
jgi:hypothetical protein